MSTPVPGESIKPVRYFTNIVWLFRFRKPPDAGNY